MATVMRREFKHKRFLPPPRNRVNKFQWRSAAYAAWKTALSGGFWCQAV